MRGPAIRNCSDATYSSFQDSASTRKLGELQTTSGNCVAADLTNDVTEQEFNLIPLYVQVEGAEPSDSLQDSLTTDGGERLVHARNFKNPTAFAADGIAFDVVGSLTPSGEVRTYHLPTGRLLERAGGTYAYDRAGNLVSWTPQGGPTWTYTYDPLDQLVAVG